LEVKSEELKKEGRGGGGDKEDKGDKGRGCPMPLIPIPNS